MTTGPERLRVCYVLSQFHPRASGAERQALAQGRILVERGHSVRVVTRSIPGEPRDDAIDGVQIHRWVETSSRGPLFAVSFVAGVIAALRRLRPEYDLIHTHQGLWEAISTGAARPWLRGAPTLIQPASSGFYGEAEEMARTKGFPLLRRLALRNTAFAAISADIEGQWRALGVPASRMVRTASGVDADQFRPGPPRPELIAGLPPGPRVVFTGRLHPQKNLDFLVDLWPDVTSATGAVLVLVGDGPERGQLEDRVRALGLGDRVHFAGAVADPSDWLRAGDLFVLPSRAEGMSNSLLEAMATGLPCVATAIGGNVDLIDPGQTGRLVPLDDRAGWVTTLVELLNDPGQRARLGAGARARVDRSFSLRAVVDRYEDLYRRLLAGRPIHDGPGDPA